MIVAPSFLTADWKHLESEIKSISAAKWLHFDVMDGVFVPSKTYDYQMVATIKNYSNQFFDCHLMVENPLPDIYRYVKAGANLVTVHFEALGLTTGIALQAIRDLGAQCGISIKPATPIDTLIPYLNSVDLVLIMSVEPGKGGQKFLESALDKIIFLNQYREAHHLTYIIEVDGGINLTTGKLVAMAGADVAVAGSFIFNQANREQAIKDLEYADQN